MFYEVQETLDVKDVQRLKEVQMFYEVQETWDVKEVQKVQ